MLPFSRDYTIYLSILNSLSQSFPKLVSINFGEEIKTDIIFRLVDKFYSHYLAIITISKLVSTFSRVILKKNLIEFSKTYRFEKAEVQCYSMQCYQETRAFFKNVPINSPPVVLFSQDTLRKEQRTISDIICTRVSCFVAVII